MRTDYIKWLSDLSKKDVLIAGGKGANLGEMFNSGYPVPQAFVVTTDAFFYFIKEAKLEDKIKDLLHGLDVDNTAQLQKRSLEIKELIIESTMPSLLRQEILESYDHFNIDLDGLSGSPGALAILRSAREPIFVSVRSSATAEDLVDASFAGQQESFINIKGNEDVIESVKKVFASIFTARSIFYRKKKGFEDLVGIAVIVQKMINAEKSGVIFSKHPVNLSDDVLIEAVFGLGEGIVSGKIKPDQHTLSREFEVKDEKISDKKLAVVRTSSGQTKTVELTPEVSSKRVLKTHELKQLADYAIKLEEHYDVPQDIEFSIEDNEIFILQTRPITTLGKKELVSQEIDGQILTKGLAASPGVASGVVKIIKSMEDLSKVKDGDVLVTTMTNPDMVMTMQKAAAIVTSEGGITAHAAIVSREMGIPAVVGTQNALDVLQDGMKITVDGFNGKVFSGVAENKSVEILPVVETKTKIKVMVDLPKFAKRAAKTNADGVGLIRLEGLIATSGKHPLSHEKNGTLDEYERILKEGLKEIAENFSGKPIWVRSSDIRSDEYANLEGAPEDIEKNPMLGNHGIRFSLKHDKIFRAELRAIKSLCDIGHKFGIMFPQVISVDEVKKARTIFDEEGCTGKILFGVMIETPAASILIKDIVAEKIDFISFGTNDLTQYTLAIDRGNEDVQYIYDEMNWAVLKQISRVIRECKVAGVETSICGQAGSNPEMVKFLVKCGIDSISVNADSAKKISELVADLEKWGGKKDNVSNENRNKSNNTKVEMENEEVEIKVNNNPVQKHVSNKNEDEEARVHEGGQEMNKDGVTEFHSKGDDGQKGGNRNKFHGKNKHKKHWHGNEKENGRVEDVNVRNHGNENGKREDCNIQNKNVVNNNERKNERAEDVNVRDKNIVNNNAEAQVEKSVQNREVVEAQTKVNKSHEPEMEEIRDTIKTPARIEELDEVKEIPISEKPKDSCLVCEPISEEIKNPANEEKEPIESRVQETERPDNEPVEPEDGINKKKTEDIFN